MIIIGAAGQKNHGKDTFIRMVRDKLVGDGFYVAQKSFGDFIKEGTAAMLHVPVAWFHDELKKESPLPGYTFTAREALEWANDVVKEKFGRGFYAAKMRDFYIRLRQDPVTVQPDFLLIPDFRFVEEASWAHQATKTLIYRIVDPRKAQGPTILESELGLPDRFVKETVFNSGSLPELQSIALKVVEGVLAEEFPYRV